MRAALEITAHETVFAHADVESRGTRVFHRCRSVFLHQRKHTQDAADAGLSVSVVEPLTELARLRACVCSAPQQLRRAERHFLGMIFLLDAVAATPLAQMLAEKLIRVRMQDTHIERVPLHLHGTSDPS